MVDMALDLEKEYYKDGITYIAGCDEAGRGCLLGPVVASAVILPKDFTSPLINDSKKLSEKQREEAYKVIMKNAIAVGVGIIPPEKIDEINILEASRLAMEVALDNMNHPYDFVLTDAVVLRHVSKPQDAIIKGDAKALPIAAASIIMGGHCRIGFEDNLYMEKGVLAKSNGELVEKVVRIAKELGRPIATSDEAREILGLPKRN